MRCGAQCQLDDMDLMFFKLVWGLKGWRFPGAFRLSITDQGGLTLAEFSCWKQKLIQPSGSRRDKWKEALTNMQKVFQDIRQPK